MDFKILRPEQVATFQEILQRIQRLQSGGTLDSLREIGANTDRQTGASYLSLKNLAASYPNEEWLALLLWNRQTREEQIIACLLFPADINKEKITQLVSSCINYEIAGYLGSLYLHKREDFPELATAWLDSDSPYLQVATLTAMAKYLILNKTQRKIPENFFRSVLNRTYTNRYVRLVAERYRFNI